MIHLCKDSPQRPPDWRWERALRLRRSGRSLSRRVDDAWVAAAKKYQADRERCTDEWDVVALAARYPALLHAHELWTRTLPHFRAELEARLLTGDGVEAAAARMGLDLDVVKWYEALFFHVTDRVTNRPWVVHCVIGPAVQDGLAERDYGPMWKLLGWAMGDGVLDVLVSGVAAQVRPDTAGGVRAAIVDQARAQIDRKALIASVTLRCGDAYAKLQLLELQAKLREIEQAAGAGGSDESFKANLDALLRALPWGVGRGGRAAPDVPALGPADAAEAGGVEPRAAELLAARAGWPAGPPAADAGVGFPKEPAEAVT